MGHGGTGGTQRNPSVRIENRKSLNNSVFPINHRLSYGSTSVFLVCFSLDRQASLTNLREIVSQDTISQYLTRQDTISQYLTRQDTISQYLTSQDTISQYLTSQDTISQYLTRQDNISQYLTISCSGYQRYRAESQQLQNCWLEQSQI